MKHNGFTRNTINDYHSYRDWTPHVRTRRDSTATRCCTMVRVGTGTIGRRAGAGRKALVRANARRRFAASKIPVTLGIANGWGAPAPTLRSTLRFKVTLRGTPSYGCWRAGVRASCRCVVAPERPDTVTSFRELR